MLGALGGPTSEPAEPDNHVWLTALGMSGEDPSEPIRVGMLSDMVLLRVFTSETSLPFVPDSSRRNQWCHKWLAEAAADILPTRHRRQPRDRVQGGVTLGFRRRRADGMDAEDLDAELSSVCVGLDSPDV